MTDTAKQRCLFVHTVSFPSSLHEVFSFSSRDEIYAGFEMKTVHIPCPYVMKKF